MRRIDRTSQELAYLDELIEEITTDANGETEQLWAFRQALEDDVTVPCEASVIGEPVEVVKFDFDGNERRGLTAVCRRADGRKHLVAAADVAPNRAGDTLWPTASGWGLSHSRLAVAARRDPKR